MRGRGEGHKHSWSSVPSGQSHSSLRCPEVLWGETGMPAGESGAELGVGWLLPRNRTGKTAFGSNPPPPGSEPFPFT